MWKRIIYAGLFLICGVVSGQELVISGRIMEATTKVMQDKPIRSAVIKVLDAKGDVLKQGLSQADGKFNIEFPNSAALTGNEIIRVEAAGFSQYPMIRPIRLVPASGSKTAYQADFLLTSNKLMRESAEYRTTVAQNALEALSTPGQQARARDIYASMSSLPDDSRTLAFESVKAQSASAYTELLSVNAKFQQSRMLATELKDQKSPVVPTWEPSGKLRITGPVTSQGQMDDILKQAGQRGFGQESVINNMHLPRN